MASLISVFTFIFVLVYAVQDSSAAMIRFPPKNLPGAPRIVPPSNRTQAKLVTNRKKEATIRTPVIKPPPRGIPVKKEKKQPPKRTKQQATAKGQSMQLNHNIRPREVGTFLKNDDKLGNFSRPNQIQEPIKPTEELQIEKPNGSEIERSLLNTINAISLLKRSFVDDAENIEIAFPPKHTGEPPRQYRPEILHRLATYVDPTRQTPEILRPIFPRDDLEGSFSENNEIISLNDTEIISAPKWVPSKIVVTPLPYPFDKTTPKPNERVFIVFGKSVAEETPKTEVPDQEQSESVQIDVKQSPQSIDSKEEERKVQKNKISNRRHVFIENIKIKRKFPNDSAKPWKVISGDVKDSLKYEPRGKIQFIIEVPDFTEEYEKSIKKDEQGLRTEDVSVVYDEVKEHFAKKNSNNNQQKLKYRDQEKLKEASNHNNGDFVVHHKESHQLSYYPPLLEEQQKLKYRDQEKPKESSHHNNGDFVMHRKESHQLPYMHQPHNDHLGHQVQHPVLHQPIHQQQETLHHPPPPLEQGHYYRQPEATYLEHITNDEPYDNQYLIQPQVQQEFTEAANSQHYYVSPEGIVNGFVPVVAY